MSLLSESTEELTTIGESYQVICRICEKEVLLHSLEDQSKLCATENRNVTFNSIEKG